MKKAFNVAATCILLSACTTTNTTPMAFNQLDPETYSVTVSVSRSGDEPDSSYIREIHRQNIGLKFTREHLCDNGIDISSPTAQIYNQENYTLNFQVSCRQKTTAS